MNLQIVWWLVLCQVHLGFNAYRNICLDIYCNVSSVLVFVQMIPHLSSINLFYIQFFIFVFSGSKSMVAQHWPVPEYWEPLQVSEYRTFTIFGQSNWAQANSISRGFWAPNVSVLSKLKVVQDECNADLGHDSESK